MLVVSIDHRLRLGICIGVRTGGCPQDVGNPVAGVRRTARVAVVGMAAAGGMPGDIAAMGIATAWGMGARACITEDVERSEVAGRGVAAARGEAAPGELGILIAGAAAEDPPGPTGAVEALGGPGACATGAAVAARELVL